MSTIRGAFRALQGPLDLRMPDDGIGKPIGPDGIHEDNEDRLNADGTWGVADVGSVGGSGICFGYTVADLRNVMVAEDAVFKRHAYYNWEHWIRQIRYSVAAWEMTHATRFAARIASYADLARAAWTGPVVLGDPSNVPQNIDQALAMAGAAPHSGLPEWMGRACGWVAYGEAMNLKTHRDAPARFARKILAACALAAKHGTGQVVVTQKDGIDQTDVVNVYMQQILVHGVLALCYQLHQDVPGWVFDWMLSVYEQDPVDYYGYPSPPAFVRSRGLRLIPATGPFQGGDSACGWWSSCCVPMHKLTGDRMWLDIAPKFGPLTKNTEDERKMSMIYRGATSP
jgi:hypothetical protein